MGVFDSVLCRCPNCDAEIEFQSKAGKCDMTTYSLRSVPIEIAVDLENTLESCSNCGKTYRILDPYLPIDVRMMIEEA